MIEYGIACLIVIALSSLDRRAMPYALILTAGWVAGFIDIRIWPAISLIGGATMFFFYLRRPEWWAAAICSCSAPMIALDAMFWHYTNMGVDIGSAYGMSLNVLFALQLILCGTPGAKHGSNRVLSWIASGLHRRRGYARDGSA